MMRMSDAQQFYVVGIHGAPTPETAPHGFFYVADGDWTEQVKYATGARVLTNEQSVWWPAPAPPTEQAPAPEPAKRWRVGASPGRTHARILLDNCDVMTCEDAEDAVYVLNTLDAHGVAWGPGRPMEELPDGTHPRVLMRADGGPYVAMNTLRKDDDGARRTCWWPLPGEAQ